MDKNETMMQYFEWYLPDDGLWWKRCAAKAEDLHDLGITQVWLPPAYKGQSSADVGYGVYDMYDLGEFDQKGTVRTKYGTKKEYLEAIRAFHESGIKVFADIVLNHRMGGDEDEEVEAVTVDSSNRMREVEGPHRIRVKSRFTFPGRKGKYSQFIWDHTHFSGTDRNEESSDTDKIYLFKGKQWQQDTDSENGNFDYLMGMNLDHLNPEVLQEIKRWCKWYNKITGIDGVRLDAVKHISAAFYKDVLQDIRKETGGEYPAVGEYWHGDVNRLTAYLDQVGNEMSLFDVPLHYNFYNASVNSLNGGYSMRSIFDNTLVSQRPDNATTFVDNHDTEEGQALQSFVEEWFKPIAYAIIMLRKEGTPCVFYTDYYGNPARGIPMVPNLGKLIKLRARYAYGEQVDYFDDDHVVGWVRRGDKKHPHSGLAVVLSNGAGGTKRMEMGKEYAGVEFYDALGNCPESVTVDENGFGEFRTEGGNVSVWTTYKAFENIVVNE